MHNLPSTIVPLLLVLSCPAQTPVDLSAWMAESYPAVSGFGDGSWTVASGGTSVTQSVNGQPTMFYSAVNAAYLRIEGQILVTGTDDDYIGFALGFRPGDSGNPNADYLLLDWKRGSQNFNFGAPSCTPGGLASAGLAVSRVEGVPTADELWAHVDHNTTPCSGVTDRVTELQRGANLGATGWAYNRTYLFRIDFTPSRLVVHVDNQLEIDVTGVFQDGRIAFYNFSQASVTYSAFTTDCIAGWANYGVGFPGTIGVPELAASAAPQLGTTVDLELTSAITSPAFALLLYGYSAAAMPSGYGGTILAQPDFIDGLLLPAAPATATRGLAVPADPLFCGLQIYTQFGHLDNGAAQGIAFSRGMQLSLGQ